MREQVIDTAGLMIQGVIVKAVLKQSSKLNVDMIILGSQQHSFILQCLLGSICDKLVLSAQVPVLVVPKAGTHLNRY
ncbi:MAG: nucleotide-binding universal stress UspA family protein [Pseudohongiellaceae bacterium]|jgi:nucleotide-binding universal stress UspA family protein